VFTSIPTTVFVPIEEQIRSKVTEIQALRDIPLLVLRTNGNDGISRSHFNDVYQQLKSQPQFEEMDVILESFGGNIDSAYKISKLLKQKARTMNVIIPHFAKSAATLISIAADNIILAPKAELGPLDAQVPDPRNRRNRISALDTFKSLEFLRMYALETMDLTVRFLLERGLTVDEATDKSIIMVEKVCNPLMCQIDPVLMGEYERILSIAEEYGARLLESRMTRDNAEELLDKIIKRYPSHSFVIDLDELASLNITSELANPELTIKLEELDDLFSLSDKSFIEAVIPQEEQAEG